MDVKYIVILAGFFSGPNEKRIPKKTQGDFYPLTFYPKEKTNDVTGRLILNNLATQELYEYKLIGRIDDPLAEGSLEIVCNAKESVKKTIVIKNPTDVDKIYTVETDMADIVSGLPTFNVRSGESCSYEITVRPILGKVYFGKITFIDQKKNTIWYTIKIEAKSQFNNIDSPIEMRTCIRKAIFLKFLLDNPTKETVFFKIDYEGEYLFGEKEFKLDGNKSADYELYYAPLKVGKKEGTIHIYNENIGEFLYKLSLICEENTPIYPDVMKSELGRFVELPVILDNPMEEEIELFYKNTNVINFSIIPDKISLPPYSKYKILIRYTPSSIDFEEETTIIFENSKVGKWEYHIRGKGVPPTEMEKTIVSTYVGGITSGMINFKNPFKDYLNVSLELKSNVDSIHTFKLMLKKEKYSIQPFRVLQIPFSFSPENLTKYFAELYVYVAHSKSIFWKFPIEGITEVKSKEVDFVFKTKAKKLYDKEIPLDLTSLPNDITNEVFSLSLSIKEEKYKGLIEKCLSIELLRNFLIEGSNKLPIRVKFYPLRPFKTDCELIISKSHGGNWIFNTILESIDPDPDDIIHIQSSLGKKSSVSFKLHNVFTKHAKFVAYFSHDSTAEFSVEPREGFLDQSGK
jgi:hypothetical protein